MLTQLAQSDCLSKEVNDQLCLFYAQYDQSEPSQIQESTKVTITE